jgi:hypothetical protein
MSRRNPTNERYKKDSAGHTRKSASSAKPKRDLGERTTDKVTKKTGIVESGKKRSSRKFFEPLETSDEMKRWRKIWWGYILGSLALIAASQVLRDANWGVGKFDISMILVTLAYASIFTALYIDFTKIRRLRKEALEANRKKTDKKDKNEEKKAKNADKKK